MCQESFIRRELSKIKALRDVAKASAEVLDNSWETQVVPNERNLSSLPKLAKRATKPAHLTPLEETSSSVHLVRLNRILLYRELLFVYLVTVRVQKTSFVMSLGPVRYIRRGILMTQNQRPAFYIGKIIRAKEEGRHNVNHNVKEKI